MYVVMPNFLILDSQSNLMSTRPERMGPSNSRGVPVLPVTWHQKSLKTITIQKLPMSTHSESSYGRVSPNGWSNNASSLISTRRLTLSFSFTVCKLEMPYFGVPDELIERKVVYTGLRPKIDPKWPNSIRRLLQDCFAMSPRRPKMEVVCEVLRHEINQLSDKKLVDEDVLDSARSAMSARYISAR